jgi:hypothetical protein
MAMQPGMHKIIGKLHAFMIFRRERAKYDSCPQKIYAIYLSIPIK